VPVKYQVCGEYAPAHGISAISNPATSMTIPKIFRNRMFSSFVVII
jgi:hypothetical protein